MFKSQFESFLRRFEADWVAERDTEPPGIDDGKYILRDASSEVLSFKSQIVKDDGQGLTDILQDALKRLKNLGDTNYIWMEASPTGFLGKGNECWRNSRNTCDSGRNLTHVAQD